VAVVLNIAVELWASEDVEERLHEALLRDGVVWSTERNDPAEPTRAFRSSIVDIGCQLSGVRTRHRIEPSVADSVVRVVDFSLDLFQHTSSHSGTEREARC